MTIERHIRRDDALERVLLAALVIQMQVGELLAGAGEGLEVRSERDEWQVALEVVGELGAIAGMVQQAVDVVEDVPLGDLL